MSSLGDTIDATVHRSKTDLSRDLGTRPGLLVPRSAGHDSGSTADGGTVVDGGTPADGVHLEQAVLRRNKTLQKNRIFPTGGGDMRHTQGIADNRSAVRDRRDQCA